LHYSVVFDIRNVDFMTPGYQATGLIILLSAIAFFVVRRTLVGRTGVISAYVLLGIVGACTTVVWVSTVRGYRAASIALEDGRASVVEGLVSEFDPMPVTGHASESFCIERQCFHYSDFVSSIGFNNAASHGGPIKPGMRVRVSHLGNTILKLEVAPGASQPPNNSLERTRER
jgi:hypothetical protein